MNKLIAVFVVLALVLSVYGSDSYENTYQLRGHPYPFTKWTHFQRPPILPTFPQPPPLGHGFRFGIKEHDANCTQVHPIIKHFQTAFKNNFPNYPDHPTFKIHELPNNYFNKTHHTQVSDNHHITINQTVHKKDDGNFKSFFHKKVIHFRPHDKTGTTTKTPDQTRETTSPSTTTASTTTPVDTTTARKDLYTTPESSSTTKSSGRSDINPLDEDPETDNTNKLDETSNSGIDSGFDFPAFPGSDDNVYTVNSESNRILRRPNYVRPSYPKLRYLTVPEESKYDDLVMADDPQSAGYFNYNDLEFNSDSEPPKDLASDTRVNRIKTSKNGKYGGMIRAHPESEIVDLHRVIESIKPLDH